MLSKPNDRHEGAWPSKQLRLILVVSFGGLLALMVVAGVGALSLARQLHTQEEAIHEAFLARSQPLLVLSSSIYVYNDRMQEYLLSENPQSDGLTAQEFSRLTAQIDSRLKTYPRNRQPEERAILESLNELFTEQQSVLSPVLAWSEKERQTQAWRYLNDVILPQRLRIAQLSQKVAIWNNQQMVDSQQKIFTTFAALQARQTRLLATALAAGLALSLASIAYLLRLGKEAQQRYHELARNRAELAALSAQLVDAQESERRSISRELHDEVGQSLGAMLVEVGRLATSVPSENAQVHEQVEKIQFVAKSTVETVRNIALLLRPSMLDDLGLIAALEWQGREISRRGGMEVEIQSEEISERMPDEYKICIYRLVQEALNNAARHSSARNAKVAVEQAGGKILVRVSDNGVGFNPQKVRGLGILGMEERVRHLGGTLTIESKPGYGTILTAEFPPARS